MLEAKDILAATLKLDTRERAQLVDEHLRDSNLAVSGKTKFNVESTTLTRVELARFRVM